MGRHDLADQRAFAGGEKVFALSDAVRLVRVIGPDALKLVSALTTLPPGLGPPPGEALGAGGAGGGGAGCAEGLLLDGQGHILFGFMAVAGADQVTLFTDGSAEALAALLQSRRFRLRASAQAQPGLKVALLPGGAAAGLTASGGPAADGRLADATGLTDGRRADGIGPADGRLADATGPADGRRADGIGQIAVQDNWPGPPGPAAPGRYPRYALDEPHPGAGWRGLTACAYDPAERPALPERLERLGYRRIDAAALEALRVAAWRPLASREAADSKTLPHELDWLRAAVPVNSGCYPGQETVAKIVNVGKPPRRLVFLHLDGSDAALPRPGAAVIAVSGDRAAGGDAGAPGAVAARAAEAGEAAAGAGDGGAAEAGRPVGRVTSAGVHHQLGPIALALVKRSLPEDAALAVAAEGAPGGLIAAAQTRIVPASGESDARPALRRTAPPKLAARRRAGAANL
ncbi:MAG: tRNA-modifying protein YgfZ [Bifidobacteriaceae bacterium]|jgi:folate-binding protein YgfZ|nr:tRNA-modifying protein YgfZ [Bifidobacteriaceae bacterium]